MSRIDDRFYRLRATGKKGFIPFVTAGDPDISTSLSIIRKLAEKGADIIELGVPFSDPMADGPVIQRSSQRAICNGTNLSDVLKLASEFRMRSDVPIVVFSYFNPIHNFGLNNFYRAAAKAGIDGLLLTDVVDDEAAILSRDLAQNGIDLISLVSPTTTDARLRNICRAARGFIYAVSRNGTTGQQDQTGSAAKELVERTRRFTDLPIAVGFGISTYQQISDVWRFADAAVVGSAIVAEIERAESSSYAVSGVDRFIDELLTTVAKIGAEN
jgi:tryptophan synthase alpha chain